MFYLEYQSTRFWSCEKKWSRKVKIHFGKCGFGGTTIKKDFETAEDAQDYMDKQVSAKRIQGYVDVNIPETKNTTNSSASTQKSALTARSNSSRSLRTVTPTKEKVGLKRHAPPNLNNEEEIKVDSGLAKIDSALFSKVCVHPNLHAKLAVVDKKKNIDRYYILQVLIDNTTKRLKGTHKNIVPPMHYLFTRWGRTGTGGQAQLEGPFDGEEEVEEKFATVFRSKTSVDWSDAVPGMFPEEGKYSYLKNNINMKTRGKWHYFLRNDPLGKPDGWYPYDKQNSADTEELYKEYISSNNSVRFSTRFIHSESSGFTYEVDLVLMSQKNTMSGTLRSIARHI